ncbi:MAG: hypothetical protein LBI80_05240 [Endomicrobium sp.]|jgi:hypothetical protein|nr:hypothetical protein [Endomicrobium sp.]
MENSKKANIYKCMFLTSTACGALGGYFLYKHFLALGWTLVCIWAILAILVRALIIIDKKSLNKKELSDGTV